ncbi:BTAD domain-containing putative transcriptional regulator [Actinophytocola sp.]|uniref:AfsR/SARP family transcriptional regulator n=1 Tax=Actinophytocola sp. TaxID=1872138 RepID=UPI00389AEEDB
MQNRQTGTAVQPHLSVPQDTPPAGGSTHGSDRAIMLGLLGPLLLLRAGRHITPSAPKLRLVLSLLAVQANSVTRVDQLVEELWGESPPPSALTTVQTYIYQLRKLLKLDDAPPADDPARPALLSHPGGYILQLPDLSDVDANLFEQLSRRGRAELLGAHAEAAAETFRDALALWRGNVLEGVPTGPVLYAHATRLEELRRSIVTLRIEADLQLGRHHELIGELGSMVASEPTREDICAKLMVALYRSGRRVDALNVYQRMRTVLIDELGLDPAAELQRLHQLMLEANPELDLPERPAVAPQPVAVAAPPAPAQLPADIPDFVGREAQLEALTELLSGGETVRVVNVVGRPGTGKNALVVRAAREVRENFPDGQLYVDLVDADDRPTPTREVLAGMLRALGSDVVPESLGEAALLFRSWTADRRLLVVLNKASDEHLPHHLLPTGAGCAVVVVSRAPLDALSGAVRVRVPTLSTVEAVAMLASTIGQSRVDQERAAAVELVELADRLPLALRAVGARLAARPAWHLARMVERMRDENHRLTELSYGGFDVLDRFAAVFQGLSARQRWVLRRLAAAEGEPLTVAEIATRAGMSVAVVHDTLDELVDADLVEELDTREEEPLHQVPELVKLVGLSGLVGSTWWRSSV